MGVFHLIYSCESLSEEGLYFELRHLVLGPQFFHTLQENFLGVLHSSLMERGRG